jgi:hypothetical protein
MTDATGRKLQKWSVVYHQPWQYSTSFTPHELLFIKTVNGHENDDGGLFIHRRDKEVNNPTMVVHWYSEIWPTAHQAIQAAIAKCHQRIGELFLEINK